MVFVLVRFALVLIVFALVATAVVQVAAQVRDRRRSRAARTEREIRRRRRAVPPHQRVSDPDLVARAVELRRALDDGQITMDEAVGSLVRFGGAAISPERARTLLGD